MSRFRELDGLRGTWSFLLVVVHAQVFGAEVLYVFMDGFFALSAFVIATSLARKKEGSFGARLFDFHRRRAARILPGYFITAFAGIGIALGVNALAANVAGKPIYDLTNAVHYLTFVQFTPLYLESHADYVTLPILDHTWSLAIEEQFYLVGGLLLVASRRGSARLVFAALFIGIGVWSRQAGVEACLLLYHLDAFGYGILASILYANAEHDPLLRERVARIAKACFFSGFALYLAMSEYPGIYWRSLNTGSSLQNNPIWMPMTLLTSMACGALVLWFALNAGSRGLAWFRHPVALYLGRISYALYLCHVLLTDPGFRIGLFKPNLLSTTVVIIFVSIGAAHFFTQVLEKMQGWISKTPVNNGGALSASGGSLIPR